MGFDHVGKHCEYGTCRQRDYLPFECSACHHSFCRDHRTYEGHECTVHQRQIEEKKQHKHHQHSGVKKEAIEIEDSDEEMATSQAKNKASAKKRQSSSTNDRTPLASSKKRVKKEESEDEDDEEQEEEKPSTKKKKAAPKKKTVKKEETEEKDEEQEEEEQEETPTKKKTTKKKPASKKKSKKKDSEEEEEDDDEDEDDEEEEEDEQDEDDEKPKKKKKSTPRKKKEKEDKSEAITMGELLSCFNRLDRSHTGLISAQDIMHFFQREVADPDLRPTEKQVIDMIRFANGSREPEPELEKMPRWMKESINNVTNVMESHHPGMKVSREAFLQTCMDAKVMK